LKGVDAIFRMYQTNWRYNTRPDNPTTARANMKRKTGDKTLDSTPPDTEKKLAVDAQD
jgi:hypothetical protein